MPQIIIGPGLNKIDGSLQKATYAFLAKLAKSDETPGLHIEPINNSVDTRVRTGRVDITNRAVLFKIQGSGNEASYVFAGTYSHDEAIAVAQKFRMDINPRNGIAELIPVETSEPTRGRTPAAPSRPAPDAPQPKPATDPRARSLRDREYTVDYLADLGFAEGFAEGALDLTDSAELLEYAESAPATWQGHALLDLFTGESVSEVRERYGLDRDAPSGDTDDERLLDALQHPAAQMEFAFVDGEEELRKAIEEASFNAWRVFLHPEQRALTTRNFTGSARITGGAGTGKTVVLIHRARELWRRNPQARIVLTTFNRTLAESLQDQIRLLDPNAALTDELGAPGVFIGSVDQIAHRIVAGAGDLGGHDGNPGPVVQVLGPRTAQLRSTRAGRWQAAADQAGGGLPPELTTPGFLEAEYAMVVLPNGITTEADYLRVRRPGRGVPLNRARRQGVWTVVSAYRAAAAAEAAVDYEEKAAIATSILSDQGPMADHVLIDEGQDLSPVRFQLLRALAAEGQNDLFVAEDGHQRIYGQKLVLSHFGINIRGRASARLTLNYRTTEQNLRFALGILEGQDFTDITGESDSIEQYRSARTGPSPELIAVVSLAEEYGRVAEIVSTWLSDPTISPDSIGLLVATRKEAENLVRALGEHDLRVSFVDRDAGGRGDLPQVMTMHRSKGMEFSRAILVGVGAANVPRKYIIDALPEGDREDALQRERSLLYVAATRARDQLVVMWTGRSSEMIPSGAHKQSAI
ncbi:ATP-dependent helicase [Tsukamurella tyrosinosolvens]|nr:3'-5' exonuclease [Tsukamurella tyrosinosolvens]KXP05869.1 DNA helicase UvrD [Tsukamurella tyrosinosolvens]KZL95703.1 DNA helicase UvrD [Tsukamurella tyrosinosolvens]MCA4993505.1 ATP-dependent helicase [Tsukamurella tyrosinosolvens]